MKTQSLLVLGLSSLVVGSLLISCGEFKKSNQPNTLKAAQAEMNQDQLNNDIAQIKTDAINLFDSGKAVSYDKRVEFADRFNQLVADSQVKLDEYYRVGKFQAKVEAIKTKNALNDLNETLAPYRDAAADKFEQIRADANVKFEGVKNYLSNVRDSIVKAYEDKKAQADVMTDEEIKAMADQEYQVEKANFQLKLEEAKQAASDLANKVQDEANNAVNKVKEKFNEVKQASGEKLEEVGENLQK